ncbi:MAG: SGNH/GDSL hydrolase family protein [Muribaculaceae bacterium]|nr:SGNH/GDSL hydrolase family protein [Muribaculaceae bacterium]
MSINRKIRSLALLIILGSGACISAANPPADWAKLGRYAQADSLLLTEPQSARKVVFIGNSITDNWAKMRPEFFSSNAFVGRGISGQTSSQMLVRFRQDVINLQPIAVVINAGTNDVAENTGPYMPAFTQGNIMSMVELARAAGITPILSTVLPAAAFRWRPEVTDAPEKISALNEWIRTYAAQQEIPLIDYYKVMVADDERSLNPAMTKDGVHPLADAYEVMEQAAIPIIRSKVNN